MKDTPPLLTLDEMTEHYRLALLSVVAGLFSTAGFAPGAESVGTIRRHLRTLMLRGLGRAEAAARRIILIYELRLKPEEKTERKRNKPSGPIPHGTGKRRSRAFPLADEKRRGGGPRREHPPGTDYGEDSAYKAEKPAQMPDDEICAESVRRRLEALLKALNDPMAQARRMARLRARTKAPNPYWPMRYGTPPGWKKLPKKGYKREDERVLRECHKLAHRALEAADTS